MKHALTALAFAATLLLGAGCADEPDTTPNPALVLAPGLELHVSATQPRLRTDANGSTHATFEVKNPGAFAQIVEYKAEWKDSRGEVVDTITGNWTTLRIEPTDVRTVTVHAPGKTAEKVRIYVREYKAD